MTRSATALDSLVSEVRELMAEETARRGVGIDIEVEQDLPQVALDRVQIQQVLVNLMRNGMEATASLPESRSILVRVRRAAETIRIEVSDSGPGIACPERVFEPFFTTKEQGMGMGLAICRSIVESHGGRLWAENGKPRGATFAFTLPVDAQPQP